MKVLKMITMNRNKLILNQLFKILDRRNKFFDKIKAKKFQLINFLYQKLSQNIQMNRVKVIH